MIHLMIDLETIATTPDCVILSLGALKFDPYKDEIADDGIYIKFNIEEQTKLGRVTNEDTLAWWSKQAQDVQDEAFSEEGRINLEQATSQLNKFFVGTDKIWAHGPVFDIVILENLYRQLNKSVPWTYSQVMDSRTLFNLGEDPRNKDAFAAHHPLADCYYQAKGVQEVYKRYGIKDQNANRK